MLFHGPTTANGRFSHFGLPPGSSPPRPPLSRSIRGISLRRRLPAAATGAGSDPSNLHLGNPVLTAVDTDPVRWDLHSRMDALAVVLGQPGALSFQRLDLPDPEPTDVLIKTEWSSISTGTERLLWTGAMPPFPGLGYPLVPGYESVGRVVACGKEALLQEGQRVFVPGAKCFGSVKALFGGSASRLVVPQDRVVPLPDSVEEQGVLLALAATAHHALSLDGELVPPDLIVGHGVLGRLVARLAVLAGGKPTVWETNPSRRQGSYPYPVVSPEEDGETYARIIDVSGDPQCLDRLLQAARRKPSIILAGFYTERMGFDFVPAFLKEAKFQVAAEFPKQSLQSIAESIGQGALSLDDLISHRANVAGLESPGSLYEQAFQDPSCLKMVLDWRSCS